MFVSVLGFVPVLVRGVVIGLFLVFVFVLVRGFVLVVVHGFGIVFVFVFVFVAVIIAFRSRFIVCSCVFVLGRVFVTFKYTCTQCSRYPCIVVLTALDVFQNGSYPIASPISDTL